MDDRLWFYVNWLVLNKMMTFMEKDRSLFYPLSSYAISNSSAYRTYPAWKLSLGLIFLSTIFTTLCIPQARFEDKSVVVIASSFMESKFRRKAFFMLVHLLKMKRQMLNCMPYIPLLQAFVAVSHYVSRDSYCSGDEQVQHTCL